MISSEYCRLMARYNKWQNTSLVEAADTRTDAQGEADQGAFFKSIAATLNHLYWADALMLERLQGNERPQDNITHSLIKPSNWSTFKQLRAQRNAEVECWANGVTSTDGVVAWYPPDGSARIEMSKALCIAHFFNHQTHHRGQIHAMLTRFGAAPAPTDLPVMP